MKRLLLTTFVLVATVISVFAMGTKVAMLVYDKSNLAPSENTASTWLTEVYGSNAEVIQPSDLLFDGSARNLTTDYKTVWVMNDGGSTISLGEQELKALGDFVKAGGNLVLTNMATPLVAKIGRINGKYANMNSDNKGDTPINTDIYGVYPNIGGNGPTGPTISPDDHRTDRIYLGMYRFSFDGRFIYPLSNKNGTNALTNACFWDMNDTNYGLSGVNKMHTFQEETNSTVVGTWQHVTDYCCACLVVFHPTTMYKGTVIACGLASYSWTCPNDINNIKILTKNMLDYQDPNPRAYGYTKQAVPIVKQGDAADIDNTVYRFNPDTRTAYLYDAHHEKMFIRRIPAVVRFDGYDFDFNVVGIDPRMAEIPLKYVDIDQGSVENRALIWYDIDVPLNPHKYFNPYVIVYVLDRDFRRDWSNLESEYVVYGESNDPDHPSTNVCIASEVQILKMEDKHPMMFPGKGAAENGYPEGHAFDVKKQIIFERNFTDGRTSTLILPFALEEDEADSWGTFYDFADYISGDGGGELKFQKHTGATVARTPYIFVPKKDQMPPLSYGSSSLGYSHESKRVLRTILDDGTEYDHSINHDNYEFHGSFEFLKVYGQAYYTGTDTYSEYATKYGNTTANDGKGESAKDLGVYAYYNDPDSGDNMFVTSTQWIGMRTFRCYIIEKNPSGSGSISGNAKRMSVMARFIEDNVTGISQVESSNTGKADGRVFNIMGQRIDASQPGLQIVNGKKYFNRK